MGISSISIDPNQIISNGVGEFIVYKKTPLEAAEAPCREIYDKVYDVFLHYSPSSIRTANSKENWISQYATREEIIRQKVKEIDSDLEITFLPRTLYELMLIHQCIEEDLREGVICEAVLADVQRLLHYPKFKSSIYGKSLGLLATPHKFDSKGKTKEEKIALQECLKKYLQDRDCWHICCFDDAGDEKSEEVKTIAFRINQVAVKLAISTIGHLSYQKIDELVEQEIGYFKTYFENFKKIWKKKRKDASTSVGEGPSISFACKTDRMGPKATGICDENDAQIIKDVIALECSEITKKALFIYRGAQFQEDNNDNYSLSYGTSLFAGIMFDVTAAAYYFMRKVENAAFAVIIPFEKIEESPFYVPMTHPICQLFGMGEFFHARSKVGKETNASPSGIKQSDPRWEEFLKGTKKSSELQEGFKKYYAENIVFLK